MNYTEEENSFQENANGGFPELTPAGGKPGWLIFLCILTFLGSGLSCLGYFGFTAAYAYLPDIFENARQMMEQYGTPSAETDAAFVQLPRAYYLLLTLLYAASVTGAAFMLSLRKIGFHLYTIAQACLIVSPVLFAHQKFNFGGLMLTVAFVLLYATWLKIMR